MKLTLNISPCPNDTFMFDALVNGRIDTRGIDFELKLLDIEQLNARVLDPAASPDISKISYAVLPRLLPRYALLDSGSALGRGNGPLLVAARPMELAELITKKVAIPGEYTTANLLLSRLFPQIADKQPMLFSRIADAVAGGECGAGVLIHEGRFTYRDRGLHLVADLGQLWEQTTSLALPLGAIVVSRALPLAMRQTVESLLRQSIGYAMENPAASAQFVRANAREMKPDVIGKHIEMFVNEYSLSLGSEGRRAVVGLLGMGQNDIFV